MIDIYWNIRWDKEAKAFKAFSNDTFLRDQNSKSLSDLLDKIEKETYIKIEPINHYNHNIEIHYKFKKDVAERLKVYEKMYNVIVLVLLVWVIISTLIFIGSVL